MALLWFYDPRQAADNNAFENDVQALLERCADVIVAILTLRVDANCGASATSMSSAKAR